MLGKGGETFLRKGSPLPSPNPNSPFPKTFVVIESLIGDGAVYRMSSAEWRQSLPVPRGGGAAGREGEGGRGTTQPLRFLSKGKNLQARSGKNHHAAKNTKPPEPEFKQLLGLGAAPHEKEPKPPPAYKRLGRRGGGGEGRRKPFSRKVPPPFSKITYTLFYNFFMSAYHALACSRSLVARLARACGSRM